MRQMHTFADFSHEHLSFLDTIDVMVSQNTDSVSGKCLFGISVIRYRLENSYDTIEKNRSLHKTLVKTAENVGCDII